MPVEVCIDSGLQLKRPLYLPTSPQPTLPQHFVWLSGKIQVKPHQFAVIAATDDVVT